MDQMNAAALMALQGQQPPSPPQYTNELQADGTLLIKQVHPDGTQVAVKIVSLPKTKSQGGGQ